MLTAARRLKFELAYWRLGKRAKMTGGVWAGSRQRQSLEKAAGPEDLLFSWNRVR